MSDPKKTGKKGGQARAANLSAQERSEGAKRASAARWEWPVATHDGPLQIGEVVLDCAVLSDGTRVISQTKFMEAMGIYYSGWLAKERSSDEETADLPLHLPYKRLKPFVDKHFGSLQLEPLNYRTKTGSAAKGIPAEILPKVCEVWLDARNAGVLKGARQVQIAEKADTLIRGFAHVGIIAMVDEATGYQYERPRRDLQEYLQRFLAEALVRWTRSFPNDYFKHLCRLKGVQLRADMRLPQYFGHLTNDLVYRRIAPGLLDALKERRAERGRASNKLHWWTSEDTGHPTLLLHLGMVVGLMKIHHDYDKFKEQLDQIAPVYPKHPGLFDDPADWEQAKSESDGPTPPDQQRALPQTLPSAAS